MIRTVFSRYWQAAVIGIITIGVITLGLGGYLTPFSRILLSPLVKGQTWLYQRFRAVQDLLTVSDDVMLLRQRNAELEAENSRLQIQVIELQQQVAEGKVLSTLVDYARSRPESRYIAAAVIGFDTSPFLRYVIINRGSDDCLRQGCRW